ncbi:hypothetical protein DFH11DRAFT_1730594 [Phellopilus nigrolimitatus]|nr:hypothetical protein DFH11DRAFT_1730594 [Phellopilus nigrolimitatus]
MNSSDRHARRNRRDQDHHSPSPVAFPQAQTRRSANPPQLQYQPWPASPRIGYPPTAPIPIPARPVTNSLLAFSARAEHDALENRGRRHRRTQSQSHDDRHTYPYALRATLHASDSSSSGELSGSGTNYAQSRGSSDIFHFSPPESGRASPQASMQNVHRSPFMYTPPQTAHGASPEPEQIRCYRCGRMVRTNAVGVHMHVCEGGPAAGPRQCDAHPASRQIRADYSDAVRRGEGNGLGSESSRGRAVPNVRGRSHAHSQTAGQGSTNAPSQARRRAYSLATGGPSRLPPPPDYSRLPHAHLP